MEYPMLLGGSLLQRRLMPMLLSGGLVLVSLWPVDEKENDEKEGEEEEKDCKVIGPLVKHHKGPEHDPEGGSGAGSSLFAVFGP